MGIEPTHLGLSEENIQGHVEHIEKHYHDRLNFTEQRLVALWHFYLGLKAQQQQKIDKELQTDIK